MAGKKCDYCSDNSPMLFPCKQCGKAFCAMHRLPAKHDCSGGSTSPAPVHGMAHAPAHGAATGYTPSYVDQDLQFAESIARSQAQSQQPREYVWEPKITEFDGDPFDPASGVVLKGVFWPKGKEILHIIIAFVLMFFIGTLISRSMLSPGSGLGQIPGFEPVEQALFPYFLAVISTAGFLIHEFAHRQTGRRYKLPAKFRLLTFGLLLTITGIVLYFSFGFPPFALPGAVVVIGLERKDQAGKCKAAGPLSNLIIAVILLPVAFVSAYLKIGFEYFVLFVLGTYMNSFLGLFNMLPIGLLDGHEIMKYKKWLWVLLFASLLGIWLFTYLGVMNVLGYWL
ncbi:MAG: hypothetical protein GYA24_06455, partial [Candidatus Lokiarchaeota archaeon]|nr:hypothetical protein [Candidatus Lokiarchaeota archaeon]